LPDAFDVGQHVGQDFDHRGADNGTYQGTRTTEQAVDHRLRGEAGTHVARTYETLMIAIERAGDAGDHASEREHQHLEDLNAVAEKSEPLLVLANPGEHKTEL